MTGLMQVFLPRCGRGVGWAVRPPGWPVLAPPPTPALPRKGGGRGARPLLHANLTRGDVP